MPAACPDPHCPPLGTFLHAEYPRPVRRGCQSSQRVVETVLCALGKAVPRAYAGPFGTAGNISLAA
jgi:N-methylhydantoinase B/oxoprolinase/acetone carboxylase alpha subunit